MLRIVHRILPAVILLVVGVVLGGCASAPTQEMSDARQSLQAAQDAGAETYARENLRSAEDYLKRAERELELRYFSRARHDAIVARSEAQKARSVAITIRDAEAVINAAAESGRVPQEARAALQQAFEAADLGKDRQAIRLALEAKRIAQETDPGD
jgi:hypothetical protein